MYMYYNIIIVRKLRNSNNYDTIDEVYNFNAAILTVWISALE